jgi:DNA-binding CsgD family transcriptional regulator
MNGQIALLDQAREQLASLSQDARRAAQLASLVGSTFSFDHIAAMLEVPPSALLGPVEELIHAGVLVDDGSSVQFPDEAVRHAVRETLPRSARPALQRQAVDVLVSAGASPAEPAADVAAAAEAGDRRAITTLHAAARSLGTSDPASAADLTRRAFDLTPAGDEQRSSLAAEAALLLHAADQTEAAKALADAALRECATSDMEAEVRHSVVVMAALSPAARVESGRAALALPDLSAAWRARHLAHLADNVLELGSPELARPLMPEAAKAVDDAGDPVATRALLLASSRLAYVDGEYRAALRDADAAALCGQSDAQDRSAPANLLRAEILLVLDEHETARELIADGITTARCRRQAWAERSWQQLEARYLLQTGRLSDAAAKFGDVLPSADDASMSTVADAAALTARGRLAIHAGDIRVVRSTARIAEHALEHEVPEVRRHAGLFLALHGLATGVESRAHELVAPLAVATGSLTPLLMVEATDPLPLVRLALATADAALATSLVEGAEERCRHNPAIDSMVATAVHARALLTQDIDALADAVRLYASGLRPLAHASALEDHGEALVRRELRERGITSLIRALRIYAASGAAWDSARVRRRLRELGVRSRVVKTPRPADGWAGLTDSEITVARLVAEGLKNREVAERLFVSRHTVSMHLRNAFAKLHINSRVELTRLVLEMDEQPDTPPARTMRSA